MSSKSTESPWLHDLPGLAALAPGGLTIGVATSAMQVEGAVRDEGREPSTWDTFMGQSGRIVDDSTAAVAADAYHRTGEDVRMLRELGADSYRFSLGWPRLQPNGRGSANRAAVAFYDRLIDELLAAGIRPMVTLHHWDMPEPLQHAGGWLNRDTAYRLADYAYLAGEAFGDRVDSWVTINEPATVMMGGYALGVHAPGATLLFDALPTAHHQLLGHGLAVEALRAADVRGGIGIANTHSPVEPASDKHDDVLQAELFDTLHNRLFSDPLLLGRFPALPEELRHLTSAFDEIEPSDLAAISRPIDFYGLNYHAPTRIRAGGPGHFPFSFVPWPEFQATGSGLPNAPEFLGVALRELADRYGDALPPVVVTAGASYADVVQRDGSIDDERRCAHLAEHLAVAFAGACGVDLQGYFVSSLLDGWDWEAGFTQPSGLVHVHADTQDRTPKRSYRFLQELLGNR